MNKKSLAENLQHIKGIAKELKLEELMEFVEAAINDFRPKRQEEEWEEGCEWDNLVVDEQLNGMGRIIIYTEGPTSYTVHQADESFTELLKRDPALTLKRLEAR